MNENTGHCQRRSPLVAGLLASLALAVANTSVAADVPGVPTAYVDGREIPFADLPTALGRS